MRSVLLTHNIVLGKDGHYYTMKDDKEGIKKQLTEKVKEVMNKSNEVEKLSQELNQWQLDCWTARDKATKAEQTLNIVQHELDTMHILADDHANLEWQYDKLTYKHKAAKAQIAEKRKKENNKLAGKRYAANRHCGKPTTVLPGEGNELIERSREGVAYRRSSSFVKPYTPPDEPHQIEATVEVAVTETECMCANTSTMPRRVNTPPRVRPARDCLTLCFVDNYVDNNYLL